MRQQFRLKPTLPAIPSMRALYYAFVCAIACYSELGAKAAGDELPELLPMEGDVSARGNLRIGPDLA